MGASLSCSARSPDIGSEASPGLLPLTDLMGQHYSFENLIFEGCGVKGYAYAGALKVLEKIGILSNIERFAGMGSGAVVACLLAAGFVPDSVQSLLDIHLQSLSIDILYTPRVHQEEILHNFGWNDSYRFFNWLGHLLIQKFRDADITFQQLYDKTGKELCIPVMNLNLNKIEYFHPKTTPDFIVRRAVSLAVSIPGIYRPLKLSLDESPEDYYMDGGIICNYPIHCFDGWWLSMKPGDRFLRKCQPALDLRALEMKCFFGFNNRSFGIMTFDDYHNDDAYDIMKLRLEQAEGLIAVPATETGRKYYEAKERLKLLQLQLEGFPEASEKLGNILEILKEDDDLVSVIRLTKEVVDSNAFSLNEVQALFGVGHDAGECSELFQGYANSENKLSVSDIVSITEKRHWQNFYAYSKETPTFAVTNLSSFWGAVNSVSNEKKSLSKTDLYRSVGIYTGHITNNDTSLHEADAIYLYQHGWNCTVAFLQEFVQTSMSEEKNLSSSSDTLSV